MKYILGFLFLIMAILSLFSNENFWYTLVDFALSYLFFKDGDKNE